jgi:ribosome-associated protein
MDRLEVNSELSIPLSEIELRASRSSGPGGQHANVTASRIEATFDVNASPTLSSEQREILLRRVGPRVTAVAQEARGQARNRKLALDRLRRKLAEALRTHERRLRAKRLAAERKRGRRRPDPDAD